MAKLLAAAPHQIRHRAFCQVVKFGLMAFPSKLLGRLFVRRKQLKWKSIFADLAVLPRQVLAHLKRLDGTVSRPERCGSGAKFLGRVGGQMGSATDKIKGVANQVGGKVKEGVGKAIGDEEMRVEGVAQQIKGKVQKTVGDAKSAAKDIADRASDKGQEKL